MTILLAALGVLTGMAGIGGWLFAANSIHQAVSGTLLIVAAVLVSGAAILEAIERTRRQLLEMEQRWAEHVRGIEARIKR